MRKKVGWIFIIGGFLLFAINFLTFGNSTVFSGSWTNAVSGIIGWAVCPLLLFVGIAILILGKKEK